MHEKATVAAIALLALMACGAAPEPEAPDPTETTSAPAVDSVPDTLPEVIARINGTEISRTEFERAIRSAEAQAGQVVPPQFRDEVYRRVLDRLIDFHLLLQESTARDMVVDDAEVDAEIARIKAGFASEDAFEARLREWQASPEVLREETRKDLLIAKVIEREIVPQLSLREDLVRDFYDQHGDQFREADTVRASHILISALQDADEATRAGARAQANALRTEAADAAPTSPRWRASIPPTRPPRRTAATSASSSAGRRCPRSRRRSLRSSRGPSARSSSRRSGFM